jgi:NADH-quinone oxidoreductase subunit N
MMFDLSVPSQLTMALGPDLLLMVGAFILLLWSAWGPESAERQRAVGIASMVLALLTLVAVGYYWWRDVGAAPGGVIAVDGFRWMADVIFLLGTLLTIPLSIDYNRREGITAGESHVLVLLATSGMMLLAAARDLMIVFLGIELMSVAVYSLSALNRRSARSAEGALKYFLLGAFSTAFLLYGMALLYGATASTNLQVIGERILVHSLLSSPLLVIGMALLLIGFAFKVAAAPFHMWAPDVYEGAPTPITAYMAAAVKAAAFAAFLRAWQEAFPAGFERWHGAIVGLAVLTMLAGNVVALAQRNIKRLLAYSSIAHAGYLLVAVAVNSDLGSSAFLFYLFAYTLATMGAFAVVVALGSAGEPNLEVEDYAGLWTVRPGLAAAMSVFMLALLGFPIFGGIGFFAKWYLIQAALLAPSRETLLAVILVLTSVISAGYYLWVVMVMFMRPRRAGALAPAPVGGLTSAVIGVTAALILALGILPQGVVRLASAGRLGGDAGRVQVTRPLPGDRMAVPIPTTVR